MIFQEKLKQLRKSKSFSQEQLANTLFISRQAISKWENGESTPDLENLIKLADFFDVTIDELVREKSKFFPHSEQVFYDLDSIDEASIYALSTCRTVIDGPGKYCNPAVFHGSLKRNDYLKSTYGELVKKYPNLFIVYINSEDFIDMFVNLAKVSKLDELSKEMKKIDIFIMSDIHLLSGQNKIQEFLIDFFKRCRKIDKQLLISSEYSLDKLDEFDSDLKNFLGWGICDEIDQ